MTPASRILVVGATARAAAHSARRAGFTVEAVDLFADLDLLAVADTRQANPAGWPHSIHEVVALPPVCPILYTGPLENYPGLLDHLASRGPLLGNSSSIVQAVRDPVRLTDALARSGLPSPQASLTSRGIPVNGSWLSKPLRSSGGLGIRRHFGGPPPSEDRYFQRLLSGQRRSALFLASGQTIQLIGLTAQWTGYPGEPYAYRGSLGPLPLAPPLADRLDRLGQALTAAFGLRGLFGLDLIVRRGVPWTVEVNPRYTASVEVLELATGRALIADHARAFEFEPPVLSDSIRPGPACVGKVVVYASHPFVWPDSPLPVPAPAIEPHGIPSYADVPAPGTRCEAGNPVLTLFDAGETPLACARRLRQRLGRWRHRLSSLAGAPA